MELTSVDYNEGKVAGNDSLEITYPRTKKLRKRLYHLDWTRAVAIIMVVFVHICQEAVEPTGMPTWQYERNEGVIKVLCTFGITIFFFCCGMAQTFKRNSWCNFVWKRFKRLMIPFFIAVIIILQPTQYISCEYGLKIRHVGCRAVYPETDAYGWPETGVYTKYNYGEFLREWWKVFTSGGSESFNLLHWLWFLPTMFWTDVINFPGSRWMQFAFEGGWLNEAPNINAGPPVPRSFRWWMKAAFEKKDVIYATTFMFLMHCATMIVFPQCAWLYITYYASLVILCFGLVRLRRSRSWLLWWVLKKLLPTITVLSALTWPTAGLTRNFVMQLQFVMFSNQGYLQQLVSDYEETHFWASGTRNCMVVNLVATIFFIGLCAPTSGYDDRAFHVPMYDDDVSGLAVLATIGNWIVIEINDGYLRAYYGTRGNPRMYFHFTQFPMILYVFHYFFVIFASTWITRPLVDVSWSYPFIYLITAVFAIGMCMLLYALLLQFKITRCIYGVRKFDPVKDKQ